MAFLSYILNIYLSREPQDYELTGNVNARAFHKGLPKVFSLRPEGLYGNEDDLIKKPAMIRFDNTIKGKMKSNHQTTSRPAGFPEAGFVIPALLLLMLQFHGLQAQEYQNATFESSRFIDAEKFAEPSRGYRQQGWLTYNLSRSTEESLTRSIQRMAEQDITGGFYLGMWGGNTSVWSEEFLEGSGQEPSGGIAYLSEAYFDLYAKAIEAGLRYGNPPLVFYDEVGYPSGVAGGLFYSKYPKHASKSLEKEERDMTGPGRVEIQIPEDHVPVGAVRMKLGTHELVDISDQINPRQLLICDVPEGNWKVMGFYLDPRASLGQGRKSGYMDFLSEEAVKLFIDLVYQSHYDHLKKYFGTVLKITHYDEPALHSTNGRAWTPRFNELFEMEHGYNPMKYYPAMWYDIGPNTAAIRNDLFGFRAKLFSESYIKQHDDWCREHNMIFSGHLDQEEIANPVPVNGDLMLMFKYQGAPGIDDIWWWGRENRSYKLVSSAAYNWDKPIVFAETYAGWRGEMNSDIVYKVAMDHTAMGANFMTGAVPRMGDKTPENDRFIGRLNYMIQHGQHISDVAILYPIASLQASFRFLDWEKVRPADVAYAREGGFVPPETDYIELGELIFRGLRQDFTFLHPSVLQDRCIIQNDKLILDNEVNRETYSALIIPGSRVLSVETARKIQAFYEAGGTVIATKILAEQSRELGRDAEVKRIMGKVFGLPDDGPSTASFERSIDEFMVYFVNRNDAGGNAYFLPDYTPEIMQTIMREVIPVWDVDIEEPMWPLTIGPGYNGSLTYIHKVKDDRHIYFFSNSSDKAVDSQVTLRGSMDLSVWDPMNGEIRTMEVTHLQGEDGQELTRVPLQLDPVTALFFVENR